MDDDLEWCPRCRNQMARVNGESICVAPPCVFDDRHLARCTDGDVLVWADSPRSAAKRRQCQRIARSIRIAGAYDDAIGRGATAREIASALAEAEKEPR